MAEEGQAPLACPPWPTPNGGFDRIMRPTRRRNFVAGATGSALGVGGANFVLGLTNPNANQVWVGAAFIVLGVTLAGILLRRRLTRKRGDGNLR